MKHEIGDLKIWVKIIGKELALSCESYIYIYIYTFFLKTITNDLK